MSIRPSTARSEISSAISDDGNFSRPQSGINPLSLPTRPPPVSHRGSEYVDGPTPKMIDASPTPTGSIGLASPMNGSIRTHVPSLTAHGFFRPMSSQRLQAQRRRPSSGRAGSALVDDTVEADETDTRSGSSLRQGPYATMPAHDRAPPSLRTDYSESETRGTSFETRLRNNATPRLPAAATQNPNGYATNGHSIPPRLDLEQPPANLRAQDLSQRSPLSLRSGFRVSSKNQKREPGHLHLSSTPASPPLSNALSQPANADPISFGKNHEYFEGNTIFCLGGRLQNARDRPINVATGIIVTLPAILFFVFSASFLWHHVTPALPIVFAYLFFVCLSSFVHASLVDPGIFPRNVHPFPPEDLNDDPLAIAPSMNDWVMVRLATSDTAAMDVPIKYCKTCNLWRPPRCYHCRVCDNCVETLDHHCVWLNNCVGRRNYRYFFAFVSSGTLLALYLAFASLGHCLKYRTEKGVSFSQAINACRAPFAMFIYGILACPYPGSLWIYHFFLVGKGETTREYLNSHKFARPDRHRPFNQGNVFANCVAVLGKPKTPTYLRFKKRYEEGDQRFGPRKERKEAALTAEAQAGGMEMKAVSRPFEGPQSRMTNPG